MRLGILTQPLKNNYGGLIQAYALKKTLEKYGHEVTIINRTGFLRRNQKISKKILSKMKKIFLCALGKDKKINKATSDIINSNCITFVNKYISNVSEDIKTNQALLEYVKEKQFEGYIVGSDQIWRPRYSPCIENFFLDFCSKNSVKRIAYAASFGVDQWEYTPKETKICSELAKLFNGISVREDSAVNLCKNYLGVEAKHVLDPTMLLEKEEYIQLAQQEPPSKGNLFYYFLDNNCTKTELIQYIENKYGLDSFDCMPSKKALKEQDISTVIDDYVFPSPTKWLRSFMDAELVITDSFHGTVFSIIFNKPFWVIYNPQRGNTRFDSLLKLFELSDRIIDITDYSNVDFKNKIDWDVVNEIKHTKKKEALSFIEDNLK